MISLIGMVNHIPSIPKTYDKTVMATTGIIKLLIELIKADSLPLHKAVKKLEAKILMPQKK